jgi:hypothetical protein
MSIPISGYVRLAALSSLTLLGCRGTAFGPGGGGSSTQPGNSSMQNLDINTVTTPLCSITVQGGYPVARACNAAAMAIPEFVGCEVDDMNALGELHAIKPGLPASQITWWCQSENATPLVLDCTSSASNPCDEVQVYPGIMIFNVATAIQTALAQGLVPPIPLAPDGFPCPNGAGGDIGGIADMDPHDGPFVNWLTNPLTDGPMLNAFMSGDFNNVATRVPLYKDACYRPSTHTLFLAQAVVARQQFNAPESGCPTLDDPFALDVNGNPNLDLLNQFRNAMGCPNPVPDMDTAAKLEAAECQTFIADERRIMLDGAMGLFPMSTVFVQLERQYAAFQNLGCNTTYGLADMNPQSCDPSCAGKTCGQDSCTGPCGLCPASNLSCSSTGTCAPLCVPQCSGKTCGPDGCGGYCGACTPGEACNSGTCQPVTSTAVSFANDVQPLLTSTCTTCHVGSKLDFAFTADVAYQNLVNVRSKSCPGRFFVVPGDSQDSYLMDKVTGVLGLCAGGAMRAGLTDPQLQTIAAWIDQGALNN